MASRLKIPTIAARAPSSPCQKLDLRCLLDALTRVTCGVEPVVAAKIFTNCGARGKVWGR